MAIENQIIMQNQYKVVELDPEDPRTPAPPADAVRKLLKVLAMEQGLGSDNEVSMRVVKLVGNGSSIFVARVSVFEHDRTGMQEIVLFETPISPGTRPQHAELLSQIRRSGTASLEM